MKQGPGAPILLIEDDPDDAFFVRHALGKAEIVNPIVAFQSAKDARNYFSGPGARIVPALFVIDVNLVGGETGLELLQWLREQKEPLGNTPVMMLTGSDRPDDRVDANRLGSVHFLQKPVTEDTLSAAVQSLGFVIVRLTGFARERTIERR